MRGDVSCASARRRGRHAGIGSFSAAAWKAAPKSACQSPPCRVSGHVLCKYRCASPHTRTSFCGLSKIVISHIAIARRLRSRCRSKMHRDFRGSTRPPHTSTVASGQRALDTHYPCVVNGCQRAASARCCSQMQATTCCYVLLRAAT